MIPENARTLIIEDNPGDVMLLTEQLHQVEWPVDHCRHCTRLSEAVHILKTFKPDIVFLDLNLPDSNGLDTFVSVHDVQPEVPIVILSGMNDTYLSVQAVKAGAQDFLVKGEFEEKLLLKTVLYGIERKKNQLKVEEANLRYKLASKATNDPLWDWDIRANKIYWNDKVQIFGYSDSLEENESWRMATIHEEDKERVHKELEKSLESGEENWSCEYRFICADGSIKYILDRGYIVRDRDNKPYRMIGTMQDLTEKILLQQSIDEEKQKQQRAIIKASIDGQEKERDHISKELHDNVNQILTGTKLHLALIKTGGDEEKVLDTVKKCIVYIDSAIREIRKLAHAMSPSIMQEVGVLDAITSLKNEIEYLNICHIKFVHAGNFENISTDISLSIFRIVQEHLSNVIKHAKAANVVISIEKKDNKIILNIIDDGVGSDLTNKKKLKGIGLMNMLNRVQSHNGNIDINSSPGNGFEILVEIPC